MDFGRMERMRKEGQNEALVNIYPSITGTLSQGIPQRNGKPYTGYPQTHTLHCPPRQKSRTSSRLHSRHHPLLVAPPHLSHLGLAHSCTPTPSKQRVTEPVHTQIKMWPLGWEDSVPEGADPPGQVEVASASLQYPGRPPSP